MSVGSGIDIILDVSELLRHKSQQLELTIDVFIYRV